MAKVVMIFMAELEQATHEQKYAFLTFWSTNMALTWGNLHLVSVLLPSTPLLFGLLSLDKGRKNQAELVLLPSVLWLQILLWTTISLQLYHISDKSIYQDNDIIKLYLRITC